MFRVIMRQPVMRGALLNSGLLLITYALYGNILILGSIWLALPLLLFVWLFWWYTFLVVLGNYVLTMRRPKLSSLLAVALCLLSLKAIPSNDDVIKWHFLLNLPARNEAVQEIQRQPGACNSRFFSEQQLSFGLAYLSSMGKVDCEKHKGTTAILFYLFRDSPGMARTSTGLLYTSDGAPIQQESRDIPVFNEQRLDEHWFYVETP